MELGALTTAEIFDLSYSENDEIEYWRFVAEIHRRGGSLEFELAKASSFSEDAKRRQICADILGQLGWAKKAFHSDSLAILISLLSDNDEAVRASAAFALGQRGDLSSIKHLLLLVRDKSAHVRHGVAYGLGGHDDDTAIRGLIELIKDDDFDVKNWATFGLAQQCDVDTPEIRLALMDKLKDGSFEVRGEALVGLARRNVFDIESALLNELEGEFEGSYAVEAAMLLEDPVYCDALVHLKKKVDGDVEQRFIDGIDEAILACCHEST